MPIDLVELHNVRSSELAVLFLNRSGVDGEGVGRKGEGRGEGDKPGSRHCAECDSERGIASGAGNCSETFVDCIAMD